MDMNTLINDASVNFGDMIGPWLIVLFSMVAAIWFKDFAMNIAKGISFKMKPGFEPGDKVYLDGEPAMIVSIGIMETIFEVERDGQKVWRHYPNTRIDYLKLEKIINK